MTSVFGGFLAFATVLGGGAIGFLASQLWWWWFHRKFSLYEWTPIEALIKKYELTRSKRPEDKKKILLVFDYVLHTELHSEEKKKALSGYAFRRWDMYVLLSLTKMSLILGVAIGAFFRFIGEYFYFHTSFTENLIADFGRVEFWILAFLLASTFLLVFFVRHGRAWVLDEYKAIHELIIRESSIKKERLKEIFPPDYFAKSEQKKNRSAEKESSLS
jgi:hypothetical protein